MRSHKKVIFIGFFLSVLLVISGCSKNKLSDDTTKVEGKGTTYSFRLPATWEKQAAFQSIYGSQAVYGAEDTRSKSNMAVVIVSKDQIEEEGFGEKTRKSLAAQNGYDNEEGVFFAQDEINGNKVFKYTFETVFQGKKMWAHYYSIFSEHAVIQFLYYSAQDSSYEDRVNIIDKSIETVKEVSYSQEDADKEAAEEKGDEISFSTDAYEVTIIGLGSLNDQDNQKLVALRFNYTNKTDAPQAANSWVKDVTLTQANLPLTTTKLPDDSSNYEIVRLQQAAEASVGKGETKEGVLLYKTNGDASIDFVLGKDVQSDQSEYSLQIPKKESEKTDEK